MHDHTTLRLPPYMCELNAWASIKQYMRGHNVTGDPSQTKLQQVTENAVKSVTSTDWESYINYVKNLETSSGKKMG